MVFFKETDFTATSIGAVPKEWKVTSLDNVAEIRGNKGIKCAEKIAFIPMEAVPDSQIFAKYQIRRREDIKSYTYCEAGDLLLAKITPSLENGKQGIVPFDVPNNIALATTEVFPIHTTEVNALFLFYVLKFSRFRNKIIASMIGTTGRQRASKESVERLEIPLPQPEEQQRITEVFSVVDSVIEVADQVIAKTERLKKGLMQQLLTRGTGHKEYKDTPIGKIPKDWDVLKLRDIAEIKGRVGWRGYKRTDFVETSEGAISLGANNITRDNRLSLEKATYVSWNKYEESPEIHASYSDIIMAQRGSLGKVAIIDEDIGKATINPNVVLIKKMKTNPFYLYYVLVSKSVSTQINGVASSTTIPLLTQEQIKSLKVPLASLQEQQKIVEILTCVDKKLELERKEKARFERIERGLMDLLLIGKIRVKVD